MEVRVTNIRVTIDLNSVIDRTPAHKAMAQRLRDMAMATLGANGQGRLEAWPELSKAYAKRVDPPVPTLLRSGRLMRSIIATWNGDRGRVVAGGANCPYAIYHQFGMGRNPYRPFFPLYPFGTVPLDVINELGRVAKAALSS